MTMLISKKTTAIVLVFAMAVLFAGCDETPHSPPPEPPQQWSPEGEQMYQSEEPIEQQDQQDNSAVWPDN